MIQEQIPYIQNTVYFLFLYLWIVYMAYSFINWACMLQSLINKDQTILHISHQLLLFSFPSSTQAAYIIHIVYYGSRTMNLQSFGITILRRPSLLQMQ